MKGSVVQPWLADSMNYMMQTVVLTALRGPDGVSKQDQTKPLIKALRRDVLHNANPNTTYMKDPRPSLDDVRAVFDAVDHYNVHWLSHFLQAAQIVGCYHPDSEISHFWSAVYATGCRALHHNPESIDQLCERLRDGDEAPADVAARIPDAIDPQMSRETRDLFYGVATALLARGVGSVQVGGWLAQLYFCARNAK